MFGFSYIFFGNFHMLRKTYHFDIKKMSAYCEANYFLLCQIIPEVVSKKEISYGDQLKKEISIVHDDHIPAEIVLIISEQCRYTTMIDINLNMNFTKGYISSISKNNFSVRLYHDVKTAEVISFNYFYNRLGSQNYPNKLMYQPDEKVQQNKLLFEWLNLCLSDGISKVDFLKDLGLSLNTNTNEENLDNEIKSK